MNELIVSAPAKVNLGLEVLQRRQDGFHDLNTVFVALDIADTLHLVETDGRIDCVVSGAPGLDGGGDNLAVRAATRMRSLLGVHAGLHIALHKRIPIGAGLGGGSSDAAAVLLGAPGVWGAQADPADVAALALELGSDVPFFLDPRPSVAAGRGEHLRPIDLDLRSSVLLVNPGIHVSTAWAFGAIGRTGSRPPTDLALALRAGAKDPRVLRELVTNDFEPAVFAAYPAIASIKNGLYEEGADFALMSGSGSTVYGLFADADRAEAASHRFPEAWTSVCHLVTALSS